MTRQEKSHKIAVLCHLCGTICTGEVLKVQDKHFHIKCFTCTECRESLASGGYFLKDNEYYCKKDYQKLFGMKCAECQKYVEGRVVTALGKMYHPRCFTCSKCRNPISTGAVLTSSGNKALCHACGVSGNKSVSKSGVPSAASPLSYLSEQKISQSPPHITSPHPMSSSSNFSLTSSNSNDPTSPSAGQVYHTSPPPLASVSAHQHSGSGTRRHSEQKAKMNNHSLAHQSTHRTASPVLNSLHRTPSPTTSTQGTLSPVHTSTPGTLLSAYTSTQSTPPPSYTSRHRTSSPALLISQQRLSPSPTSTQQTLSSVNSNSYRTPSPVVVPPGTTPGTTHSVSSNSLSRAATGSPSVSVTHQRSYSLDRSRNILSDVDGPTKPQLNKKEEAEDKIKLGKCAGCKEVIATTGTSLLALKQHWHMWCLKCVECSRIVSDELINNDGLPYCMKCFNQLHGTVCAACQDYITGRGLQADSQCFHPECARCSRCGNPFEEDDDMCILGGTLWHLRCDAELESALSNTSSARTTPRPTSTSPQLQDFHSKSNTLPLGGGLPRGDTTGDRKRSDTLPSRGSPPTATPTSSGTTSVPLASQSEPTRGNHVPGKFAKKHGGTVLDKIKLFSTENTKEEKANGSSTPNSTKPESGTDEDTKEEYALIYSLGLLQFSVANNSKLPKGADRTKLECYLSDEDFAKAFSMSRDDFSKLPMWKQIELKKDANLF